MKKSHIIVLIIILLLMILTYGIVEAKYILTREFNIQVTSAPFYFEAEVDKSRVFLGENIAEINLKVKNNDGENYNLHETKYDISILNNEKFTFMVDNESNTEKTIVGNELVNETSKITLIPNSGVSLNDVERLTLKVLSTYPYKIEKTFELAVITKKEWTYEYVNDYKVFTVPINGKYKIELWGAQGGTYNNMAPGGMGSYTSGEINLEEGKELLVYVGGAATDWNGGYNGGGSGTHDFFHDDITRHFSGGGGATDIRLVSGECTEFNSLKSRIMVAASGGGGYFFDDINFYLNGTAGGGLVGYSVEPQKTYRSEGGTQTSGGKCGNIEVTYGSFGIGGNGAGEKANYQGAATGGGTGYYGGAGRYDMAESLSTSGSGSSFISGHEGCDAISEESTQSNIVHTGQSHHYSEYVFSNTVMIDGAGYKWTTVKGNSSVGMPSHDGSSTMIGNTGNGYAKITYIGEE